MPVHDCQLDGKPGYQYGDQKCYTYEPGNEEARKEAKRKAYVQGAAIEANSGAELMSDPHIIEFAELPHVPILKIGAWPAHNAKFPIPIEDLDTILDVTNESQPILLEALDTGRYRGNDHLVLTKPIPAVMNIHHQELFPDTNVNAALRDAFRGVTATYQKETIDGEDWLTAHYHHVPNGSAATLQKHFPLRSVELLPNFTNPDTGKTAPWVIRSTAFLNQTTKPAVAGQRPELIVEFSTDESPVVRLTSTLQDTKENDAMATQKPEEMVGVDVAEFERAKEALTQSTERIAELEAKLAEEAQAKQATEKEKAQTVAELQAENQRRDAKIAEMAATLDAKEVKEFCHEMQTKLRYNHDGHAFMLSKSAMEILTPGIQSNGVFELQEGETGRQAFVNRMDAVIEMAAKGTLLVPMSMQGAQTFDAPENGKPTEETLVKEFMAADENLTEEQAWIKAQNHLKAYQGGVR